MKRPRWINAAAFGIGLVSAFAAWAAVAGAAALPPVTGGLFAASAPPPSEEAPTPPPAPVQGAPATAASPPEVTVWTPPASIIRRVDNDDMHIAITFDACATQTQSNGFDRAVYSILQREQVPATIFVSGRWVEFHPEVMEQLSADPLVEFANHSYDHPHMPRLSPEKIGAEIDRTEEALARYGRHSVAFRPPFGSFSERVLAVVRSRQLPAVLWDVVSGDPGTRATAASIERAVLSKTRSGSIIIFHINARAPQTAAALPSILRTLRARGFEFVHISTLLGAPGGGAARPTVPVPVQLAPPASSPSPSRAPVIPTPLEAGDGDAVLPPSVPMPEEDQRKEAVPGAFVPAAARSFLVRKR